VVLRPDSRSVDMASSASGASCTQAPHLVASGASGHPSQYRVLSGHISKNNTLRPMRPVRLTHLTPER